MLSVFGAVVIPMFEAENFKVRFQSGTFFLWKLKIFDHLRLSCLLIFMT